MNIYSGRTSRACITPDCQTRVMQRNPRDTCNRCHERVKTAERNVRDAAKQRAWLNFTGPLRDGQPLWRETEPGELVASMGLIVWNELRMAA